MEFTTDALKEILDNVQNPERLNDHAWAGSAFVRDAAAKYSHLNDKPSGEKILFAVAQQFRMLMPVSPPKHGVRLDSRWTEFGFLAARYFAPLLFGSTVPETFQDACALMDESILLFVYGRPAADLSKEQVETYKLIGDEYKTTPLSTLSDWNRKGLQRLVDAINMRETHLSIKGPLPSTTEPVHLLQTETSPENMNAPKPKKRKWVWAVVLILGLILIGLGYLKARRVYDSAMLVYTDVNSLRDSIDFPPSLQQAGEAGPQLKKLQKDMKSLRAEVDGYLWIAPLLGWVPQYGCEIKAAPQALDMADALIDAGVQSYDAANPFLDILSGDNHEKIMPEEIIALLLKQNGQFRLALSDVRQAREARDQLDDECLLPLIKDDYLPKADLLLSSMEDALILAAEIPDLVGAGAEGPKTYLILVQNEDELRPTGGFITAAGNLLLQDGKIISLEFTDSGLLDDWTKPYPSAPWQLREYMNSPVLIFRDANWFTHFPDSALYAEYLYSYTHDHSVDGVIAIDQHMLVMMLAAIGPVTIVDDGGSQIITEENIIGFLRQKKTEEIGTGVHKKFIGTISSVIIEKIFSGDVDWQKISAGIFATLNEKHVLLQFDNPSITDFIARHHWDGAVQPGTGDFLMVVDSNIGFNKTNVNITTSVHYMLDLKDVTSPTSNLSVIHKNASDKFIPCLQWEGVGVEGQRYYPIDRCYWDYLRVYTPAGTRLLSADPQNIPADWMIRRRPVNAKTDLLDEEIDGIDTFGLLKVIPGGREIATNFRFSLPKDVIESISGSTRKVYRLKVQKQPGTVAIPLLLTFQFPDKTVFMTTPSGAVVDGSVITLQTDLRIDREFEIIFETP